MSELNGASRLIGDMNITEDDIDNIYEELDGSLKILTSKDKKAKLILEKIEEMSKNKDDMSVKDILNWLNNQNSSELKDSLKGMQDLIIKDSDLMDFIQGLFFDKMLE